MGVHQAATETATGASTGSWTSVSCPACGGSGILRLAQRGHRTCLTCVGSGVMQVPAEQDVSAVFSDAR